VTLELTNERGGLLGPNWLLESVRLTAFKTSSTPPTALWKHLTGRDPLEVVQRTQEGMINEVGEFAAGSLFVIQQAGRIDIAYGAKPAQQTMAFSTESANPPPLELLHVGPSAQAISALFQLLNSHLEIFSDSYRLAFAPVFVQKANDIEDVNRLILAHEALPIAPNDIDILWRINRPVSANAFVGSINRIVAWQSVRMLRQQFVIGQSAIAVPMSVPNPDSALHFARVEFDVNTVQEVSVTNQALENWTDALDELVVQTFPLFNKLV